MENPIFDKNSADFSLKFFTIIFATHLAAIYGIANYYSLKYLSVGTLSHIYFITIGASIGLHRYFSHKSFKINNKFLDLIIHLSSTLCLQGGPIYWATTHRQHHKLSEQYGDPHSAKKGFFWSHMGWLFYLKPNGFTYLKSIRHCQDLKRNKVTNWFENNYLKINIVFLTILLIFSYSINDIALFFWIGPIRIVSVWHCTWLINSYAHGVLPMKSSTQIINSNLLCITTGGDGHHKYHHDNPNTPKHAEGKYHLDYGYFLLKALNKLHLISFHEVNQEMNNKEVA